MSGYYSRNYHKRENPVPDDARARFRIATYLEDFTEGRQGLFGRYIERELGIPAISKYDSERVDWKKLVESLDVLDFLDLITAIGKIADRRTVHRDGIKVEYNFVDFVQRVFNEQGLAYRIESDCSVHPLVDVIFSAQFNELIRGLSEANLSAADEHVRKAELLLIEGKFDGRQAIRSIFDAAENVFKVTFPGADKLSKDTINGTLRRGLPEEYSENSTQRRAAEKALNALREWVDAAHFYRHVPGNPEPEQPNKQFTVLMVSLGISHIRWLLSLLSARPKT